MTRATLRGARRRWRRGILRSKAAAALGLLLLLASLQTDRLVEAARPGELARLVPGRPLLLLESDDLPALVARWRDCQLRQDVENTNVYRRCEASRIALRLGERTDLIEALLNQPLSLDTITSLPGERGGLALYNISDTTFVLWLRTHHGAGADLELIRRNVDAERSTREGQRVIIHRGTETSSPLAMAVVGDILIVSNDLENFDRALALAAADDGEGGENLASDDIYNSMTPRAPVSATVHLYLDMARITQTRQFQRYWVHDNSEDLQQIDRALLSLTFDEDRVVENRILAYATQATRMPAGPATTTADGSSEADRLEALPSVHAATMSLVAANAEAASSAARWIWPGTTENGSTQLQELLARGGVVRYLDVVRPRLGRDNFSPSDQLAIAFALESPDDLDTDDVVTAGAQALVGAMEGVELEPPTARRTAGRGVTVHTLASLLPGLNGLSVSRSRDGGVLVLSNSIQLARDVASLAISTAPLGQALATPGPDVSTVDFTATRRLLGTRLELITNPEQQGPPEARRFLGEDIPELLSATGITRIERVAYRDGDFDRQIVRYIEAPSR